MLCHKCASAAAAVAAGDDANAALIALCQLCILICTCGANVTKSLGEKAQALQIFNLYLKQTLFSGWRLQDFFSMAGKIRPRG